MTPAAENQDMGLYYINYTLIHIIHLSNMNILMIILMAAENQDLRAVTGLRLRCDWARRRREPFSPASGNFDPFPRALARATRQQKLLSSPRLGAPKAYLPVCAPLRRAVFFHRRRCTFEQRTQQASESALRVSLLSIYFSCEVVPHTEAPRLVCRSRRKTARTFEQRTRPRGPPS